MSRSAIRRLRLLLAALMLLTGVMGQAGHAWAHGADPHMSWLAALQAERDWLAGTDADTTVQTFGAAPHRHGDGPAHQHDGADGLVADHAHVIAFLMPASPRLAHPLSAGSPAPALFMPLAAAPTGRADRPPRDNATLA